ncbi:putative chromatin regulator PHD family [Helianthus debilis subsp. tardiflorus]
MSGLGHDDDHDESSIFFPNGNSSDVNSKIMLVAIITLSTVVVVVTMLHVYVRYILRRQARRREAFQGIGLVPHIQSHELPKRGLEPMVIASLPILKYEDGDNGSANSRVNPECAVCLSSFEDGQMIRVLPTCKHHFHVECIDKWLESHSSCPICRHEVELSPTISPLPREPSTRLGAGARAGVGLPSAPPVDHTTSVAVAIEGTSDEMLQSSVKGNGMTSRLSSFRRMLSMDRSSRRNNPCTQDGIDDVERQ